MAGLFWEKQAGHEAGLFWKKQAGHEAGLFLLRVYSRHA